MTVACVFICQSKKCYNPSCMQEYQVSEIYYYWGITNFIQEQASRHWKEEEVGKIIKFLDELGFYFSFTVIMKKLLEYSFVISVNYILCFLTQFRLAGLGWDGKGTSGIICVITFFLTCPKFVKFDDFSLNLSGIDFVSFS